MVDEFLMTTTPFSVVAPPDLSSPPDRDPAYQPFPPQFMSSSLNSLLLWRPASGVLKPLCHPIVTLPISSFPPDDLNYAGDVKVHLRSVDAMILIEVRIEVVDGVVTSQVIVICYLKNLKCGLNLIAGDNFKIFHGILSNFHKFVSISLFIVDLFVWYLVFMLTHRVLYDFLPFL
ncbi:hypothetical protein HID58_028999 [Brassica napus]|uniref:Uncharacterized protein n=1 Tax=Brassica napus TaxID=3708 RepID=A0ABQ8CBX0_BRANA|nr:hypothetical protein HID58_028999 [Brassica napus]